MAKSVQHIARDSANSREQLVSVERTAKQSLSVNPFLLVLFITISVVTIHSLNFSTFKFQPTDAKGVMFVILLGGGMLLAMLYGLLGVASVTIADSGNTKLAEAWAVWWTTVTRTLGRLSTDHVDAQLRAAQICRFNGSYEKSMELCQGALNSLFERAAHLQSMPPMTEKQEKQFGQLAKSMDVAYKYQAPEILLTMAWNLYERGDYKSASEMCQKVLSDVEKVRLEETHRRTERKNLPEENILTRNLLEVSANQDSTKSLDQNLNLIAAGAFELLGIISSLESDLSSTNRCFEEARNLRAATQQKTLTVWKTNFGFACMNLGRDAEAKQHLEEALSEIGTTGGKGSVNNFVSKVVHCNYL